MGKHKGKILFCQDIFFLNSIFLLFLLKHSNFWTILLKRVFSDGFQSKNLIQMPKKKRDKKGMEKGMENSKSQVRFNSFKHCFKEL